MRRSIAHFNETGELLWELYDPQVELVIDAFANLAGTYLGHEGLRSYLDELTTLRPLQARIEIDEVVDAGDSVVVLARYWTRGRYSDATASELAGEFPVGGVFRMRGGRIVCLRTYLRAAEAVEAVGLRE